MIFCKGKAFSVLLSYSDIFLIKQLTCSSGHLSSSPKPTAEAKDVNSVHDLCAYDT